MSCEKKKIKLGARHLLARGNTLSTYSYVRNYGLAVTVEVSMGRVFCYPYAACSTVPLVVGYVSSHDVMCFEG